jgi:3-oxoacyl-[acyl-carrier-protein] synthase-3
VWARTDEQGRAARKYLHSPACKLGERRLHYSEIQEYRARMVEIRLPEVAELGLGYVHETNDVYRLVEESIAQTLAVSGCPAGTIDQVMFCSSHFAHAFVERNRALAAVLRNNQLSPQAVRGVSGTGCADVLSGIELACTLIDVGAARAVLVVGMEAWGRADRSSRIVDYALISDAVVSVIVSDSRPHCGYRGPQLEILACKSVAMIEEVGAGMRLGAAATYGASVSAVLRMAAVSQSRVTKIFGNNIFRPAKRYREMRAGFCLEQMYLENVERLGHCMACDSILNLIAHDVRTAAGHYVLYAEAEGHASAILLAA